MNKMCLISNIGGIHGQSGNITYDVYKFVCVRMELDIA